MPEEKTPVIPPAEGVETETEIKPTERKQIDPKEEARRRSKEDLERKRRTSHGKR